ISLYQLPGFFEHAEILMELGSVLAFCRCAHDHSEVFRFDRFDDLLKSFSFFGGMYLTGNGDNVVERCDHYKPSREGYLTAEPWSLGCYRFFQDLHQYVGFAAEYFVDLTRFDDLRLYGECA